MLTSRERVTLALNHRQPDRVPVDLGGCGQTGMHVSTVYKLRQALGLDEPGTPVKVIEPYQMLGEIKLDLLDAVGGDIVGIGSLTCKIDQNIISQVFKRNFLPTTEYPDTFHLIIEAGQQDLSAYRNIKNMEIKNRVISGNCFCTPTPE